MKTATKSKKFGQDAPKYNTFFKDTEAVITSEEGGRYGVYLHLLFEAYRMSEIKKLVDKINEKHRAWVQEELYPNHVFNNFPKEARFKKSISPIKK